MMMMNFSTEQDLFAHDDSSQYLPTINEKLQLEIQTLQSEHDSLMSYTEKRVQDYVDEIKDYQDALEASEGRRELIFEEMSKLRFENEDLYRTLYKLQRQVDKQENQLKERHAVITNANNTVKILENEVMVLVKKLRDKETDDTSPEN